MKNEYKISYWVGGTVVTTIKVKAHSFKAALYDADEKHNGDTNIYDSVSIIKVEVPNVEPR